MLCSICLTIVDTREQDPTCSRRCRRLAERMAAAVGDPAKLRHLRSLKAEIVREKLDALVAAQPERSAGATC